MVPANRQNARQGCVSKSKERHMTRLISRIGITTALVAVSASTAWSHPADHSYLSLGQSLVHLLTEPDHMLYMGLAVAVAYFAFRKYRKSA
jgi:hydrogenase/urease accessory protein HupE